LEHLDYIEALLACDAGGVAAAIKIHASHSRVRLMGLLKS
jgi:DNA-binding GntR family transcriptional regulator